MSDENLQVVITASIQQLVDALGEASSAVTDSMNAIKESADAVAATLDGSLNESGKKAGEGLNEVKEHADESSEALEKLHELGKTALEFAGIAVGVEMLKQLGEALLEAGEHAENLKNVTIMTGLLVEELQGLEAIAAGTGVSTQQLDRGMIRLNQTLISAQEGSDSAAAKLMQLGVTEEELDDPTTNLHTVLEDVTEKLHETGVNSETAGELSQVFGMKAGALAIVLEKLNGSLDGAKQKAQELHAPTEDQIELLETWKSRTADLHTAITNITDQAFSHMAEFLLVLGQQFKDMGSETTNWSEVTTDLANAFRGFEIIIEVVVGILKALLDIVIDLIKMTFDLTDALWKLLTLDFSGAKQAWNNYAKDVEEVFDDIKRNAEATGKAMQNTALGTVPGSSEKKEGGEKPAEAPTGRKDKKDSAAADEAKQVQDAIQKDYLRSWAQVVAESAKQDEEEVESKKKAAKEEEKLQAAIQKDYLKSFAQVVEAAAKEDAAIVKSREKAAALMQKIVDKATKQMMHSVDQSLKGLMHGTMTLEQAWKNVWKGMEDAALQAIENVVTTHVTAELTKTTATVAGAEERAVAEETSAKRGLIATMASAIKQIAINAVKVISAVWSALSSIPIVGPFLAPVAAFAAGAAVYGLISRVRSASSGYDIPRGVNPLTQLHSEEMVLPSKYANMIRGITGNGSGGGGNQLAVHFHVNAMDSKSFHSYLMENSRVIGGALAKHMRQYGNSGI